MPDAAAPGGAGGGAPAAPAQPDGAGEAPVAEPAVPRKRIQSQQDLAVFTESKLCQQLMSFIGELSDAVKGKQRAPERLEAASLLVRGLVEMLATLESWIEEFPPLVQPMRFGNRAFRQWHARLVERGEGLLGQVLERVPAAAARAQPLAAELAHYVFQSFGDERRIDYGTGHEAAFLAFLFALGGRGVLAKTDAEDAVLLVFAAYLRVLRRLQSVYVLEPAGSHGVWGLDDYHALPFLFGAAQLVGLEDEVPTGDVYRERIVKDYSERFLYVDAIKEVLLAKSGAPFHETSPMLYDISGVPTWQKTHMGLVRMYRAEVLGKLPVIQHFLFGPSLPWPGDTPNGA
uniref:Serine/threonine-protein phosphatase 2A activator n=1 Tax=Alexandrium catenella TaxID=2925 RepID=A0A7S1LBJ8_ALECA